MKKTSPFFNKIRIYLLFLIVSLSSVQQADAHKLFGSEREEIAVQETFYGLCQHVYEKKTYVFGICVSTELEFKYEPCN